MRAFPILLLAFLGVLSANMEHEMTLIDAHVYMDRQITEIQRAARTPELMGYLNTLINTPESWKWNMQNQEMVRRTMATLGQARMEQRRTIEGTYIFGVFYFKFEDFAGQFHQFSFQRNYDSPTNYTLWKYDEMMSDIEKGVICNFTCVLEYIFENKDFPPRD